MWPQSEAEWPCSIGDSRGQFLLIPSWPSQDSFKREKSREPHKSHRSPQSFPVCNLIVGADPSLLPSQTWMCLPHSMLLKLILQLILLSCFLYSFISMNMFLFRFTHWMLHNNSLIISWTSNLEVFSFCLGILRICFYIISYHN